MLSGANAEPAALLIFPLRTPHNASRRITAHVRVTHRNPNTASSRDRDHGRSAFNAAVM
jgi:hypothetical protein